ncbi:MAG TPA: hypothetical protein VHY84_14850 [Bryobacteraceae bacterium]|jgi:hypothetical protein|nr:hypothetical protein [Bryobacteraceae bacterium]
MLPTVTHETALMAMCDLIREEMAAGEMDDSGGPLTDAVLTVAKENPEILESVTAMTQECGDAERMSALIGMAITYRALKAQAETEALERMSSL